MEAHLGTTLLAWNNWIAFGCGLVFNLILLWLLLKRTPKEMQVHRKILLQTYFVDVFILVATILIQPIIMNDPSKLFIFFNGPLCAFFNNQPAILYILYMIWYTGYLFETLSICVQFIYRYLLLNRNMKVAMWHYLAMLSVPFCISLASNLYGFCLGLTKLAQMGQIDDAFRNKYPYLDTKLVYISMSNNSLATFSILYVLLHICCYSIIFYCARKMLHFMNAYSGFNVKIKEMQQQLTKTLIILAICPLTITILNMATNVLINMELGSETLHLLFLLLTNAPNIWMPVFNALISICTNRPYREALMNVFKKSTQQITTVSPMEVPVTMANSKF